MRANGWWDNEERTVARYELPQGWTWQDLCALLDQTELIARKQRTPVHAIVELQTEPAPLAMQFDRATLEQGRAFACRAGEVSFAIAVVGASLLFKTLYTQFQLACTNGNARLHFVDNLAQARAVLAQYHRGADAYAFTATA